MTKNLVFFGLIFILVIIGLSFLTQYENFRGYGGRIGIGRRYGGWGRPRYGGWGRRYGAWGVPILATSYYGGYYNDDYPYYYNPFYFYY